MCYIRVIFKPHFISSFSGCSFRLWKWVKTHDSKLYCYTTNQILVIHKLRDLKGFRSVKMLSNPNPSVTTTRAHTHVSTFYFQTVNPPFQRFTSSNSTFGKNNRYFCGTLKSWDDSENVQVVRVALPQTAVAALSTGQHCPIRLDHKGAVLTTHHLKGESRWGIRK